jgi:2-polyprenyl-6-methoxyphenol hydroxylase-like FAD-dependent oxidoreductase
MCGLAAIHAGHNVTIVEKFGDERQSHMAGVCLGPDALVYLAAHDRLSSNFTHQSLRVQALQPDETLKIFVNGIRMITSWDTYYYRLRACFDRYTSSYYPSSPLPFRTDGSSSYICHKQVLEVKPDQEGEGSLILSILDRKTQEIERRRADLVIGADGPDSLIRSIYQPEVKRQYVGYIAWRGTVPEREVSIETRKIFKRSVTVHMMHRNHCIMYTIPGSNGCLEAGERFLNFLWYTNQSPEELEEILKDAIDGHVHHNIVPSGHVREDIWSAQITRAQKEPLPCSFLEVMGKIRSPFIQVITEFCSPRAAFENGRVLLVGDALSLFRPHTAFSGTQAAFHASRVEEYIRGEISVSEWEEKVSRYSRLHWSQSVWWGDFYQVHPLAALLSGLKYWWLCGIDKVKSWLQKEEPLLRTSSNTVTEYDD